MSLLKQLITTSPPTGAGIPFDAYRKSHEIDGSTEGAQTDYQMKIVVHKAQPRTLFESNDECAWQRYVFPKAIYYNGKTYFAWVDTDDTPWNIRVKSFTHATETWGAVYTPTTIAAGDGHRAPAIGVLHDGKLIILYGCHEEDMKYRISTNSEDESAWGGEQTLAGNWTYPQPCSFTDRLVLFARRTVVAGNHLRWEKNVYEADAWSGWSVVQDWGANSQPYLTFRKEGNNILMGGALYTPLATTHEDIYFAYSSDYGVNWKNANGSACDMSEAGSKIFDTAHYTTTGFPFLDENGKPMVIALSWVGGVGKFHLAAYSVALGSAGSWSLDYAMDEEGADLASTEGGQWYPFVYDSKVMFIWRDPADSKAKRLKRVSGYTRRFEVDFTDDSYTMTDVNTDAIQDAPTSELSIVSFTEYRDTPRRIIAHHNLLTPADSGEDVYIDADDCRDDFGDIRFRQGVTELDYWMKEYVDGDYAVFWVKVDTIPDDPDSATIYIYYGKSDEATTSNGETTFPFFNKMDSLAEFDADFTKLSGNDRVLDTTTYARDTIKLPDTSGETATVYYDDIALPTTHKWSIHIFIAGNSTVDDPALRVELTNGVNYCVLFGARGGIDDSRSIHAGGGHNIFGTFPANTLEEWEVRIDPVARQFLKCYVSGESYTTPINYTTNAAINRLQLYGVGTPYLGNGWFGIYWVRKYAEPEPAHGAWGSEEAVVWPF